MLLNPGTVLSGRYEILEKIGSGGMAVVYRGKDNKLDRYVTVKVLREEFVGDEEFIERFRSEACSAARLSHPNIVRAYDVGEDGDVNYIVNEYIHGDTLKKAIKEKAPFDSRSTINVAIQIASALSQAHKAHIVHRDIKPQNILVGTDGVVKVTDFGIARAATASTMTTTANAAGSVHYFSPEQARGGYVDEKSDIYSLGISMFEMITGVLPFQGNNSVSIALMHINDELPDIRQYNPNCSPSLEGIIKKATMKKADERYANIDLLLADLIRARADITGAVKKAPVEKKVEQKAEPVKEDSHAGVRMSRRAEAAAQLRAAQEKAAAEKAAQAEVTTSQETKPADPKELEAIRAAKQPVLEEKAPVFQEIKVMPRPVETEENDANEAAEDDVYTPLVGFEKYSKKLKMAQISKEDEYESEYMASEKVKTSRRPERVRRNPRAEGNFENEHDRRAERKVIIAAVITALVIIGIISAVGIKFLGGGGFAGFGGFTSEEGGIETPMFLGVPYEDAVKAAEEMGIVLVQEGEDYSSFFDKGYIIYQSVSEGTMVKEGTKIGVKISLGLTEEEMPDVVGKDEDDAIEAIIRLVGDVARIEYVNDPEADPETVIEQIPDAGEKITAKSNIVLKISKGDTDSSVVVPSVVNQTESDAKASLEAVGLTVGSVSKAASDTIAEGRVITQTLAADTEVSRGSVVNLVVSTGAGQSEGNAPGGGTAAEEGTKYFTINAPSGATGDVYVRVVRNDADGAFPVVDEYRSASEFPYNVAVTGRGSGTVTCYLDNVQQWSQSVNFGE